MDARTLLHRALATFPGGSQTDAKSIRHRLVGVQPSFFVSGRGAYALDPDGEWWLDCQMGLGAYILGYADQKVNAAVTSQLSLGSLFSLSSPLELEVADLLLGIFPEYEMVRFAKNGSDVTSAAIRLARHLTGRDHVLGCGYHGFQDWSMSLRPGVGGIPGSVRQLSHGTEKVDVASTLRELGRNAKSYAAVIVDTGGQGLPDLDLLKGIQDHCRRAGVVFIMDEVVSGFRVGLRGAMGHYGMVPDLLCLGKAVANGFPLSVLLGSKRLLSLAADSGMTSTFGGDCVALAAGKATLEQLRNGSVNAGIDAQGTELMERIRAAIKTHGLQSRLRVVGYPALFHLRPKRNDPDHKRISRFLMQRLADRGVFWQESFVLCRDFGAKETEGLAAAVSDALKALRKALDQNHLTKWDNELARQEQSYLAASEVISEQTS